MNNTVFKQASVDDVEIVRDISCRTFYDTFHAANTDEDMQLFLQRNFSIDTLRDELNNKDNMFFLAYRDGKLVGIIKLCEASNTSFPKGIAALEISRLYAVKEMIGKGVGKEMMQHCINVALARKKEAVWLGVWERNNKAINFYKKWGFEKVGEHSFMVGNDPQNDWIMVKML